MNLLKSTSSRMWKQMCIMRGKAGLMWSSGSAKLPAAAGFPASRYCSSSITTLSNWMKRTSRRWAPAFLVGGLWLAAQLGWLGLPAEPWSDRVWFFNPFGWQLVFFTGFAFASGWIGAPPVSPRLVALAAAVLLVSVPFVHFAALDASPFLAAAADRLAPLASKTELGLLRYLHFLTLAYLAYVVSGPGGERLRASGATGVVASAIHKVGQQALATFVMGMICARLAPVLLDALGGSALAVAATNLAGFAVLIATAYVAGWFRTERTAPRA